MFWKKKYRKIDKKQKLEELNHFLKKCNAELINFEVWYEAF